jgi:hypothetical protein
MKTELEKEVRFLNYLRQCKSGMQVLERWRSSRATVLILLGFFMSCVAASAQSQEKSKIDLNTPGEEHKKLDVLAGVWDVTLQFPAGPGRTMEGKSSLEAKWVMDGRFLRQEYTSNFRGMLLTVVRYLGFDRPKGKFVEVQFESTHTDVMHNEGTISSDGRIITCFGSHIDTATGKATNVRSVTTFLDNDAFTVELFYGEGSKDAKTITLRHKRKKIP